MFPRKPGRRDEMRLLPVFIEQVQQRKWNVSWIGPQNLGRCLTSVFWRLGSCYRATQVTKCAQSPTREDPAGRFVANAKNTVDDSRIVPKGAVGKSDVAFLAGQIAVQDV